MNNYQLYRTNPKLGGQVAWNIVLDGTGGELKVRDFSLAPYSPYAKFAYNEDRDWLRYSHQENVSHLYGLTKGTFYDPCIDSRLTGCYPLLDEIDPKNKAEDFGASRIPYKRYGKQFSLLCPVWLEDFGKGDSLRFEFILRPTPVKESKYAYRFRTNTEGEEVVIAQSSFTIKPSEIDGLDNQTRFETYFTNYVDYISSDYDDGSRIIGDDIINITIENVDNTPVEYGSVTGLHVSSGNIVTKDITDFIPNLYERERPVMETDSLIQSNIYNNELIVKQLFNFNFAFNLSDISNTAMTRLIGVGGKVDVDVKVYITRDGGETLLERKVFDSNYVYIDKNREDNAFDASEVYTTEQLNKYIDARANVYGYLLDARCVDLIKHNKLSQYIHHWSLTDNNDYLFNLYRGFASSNSSEHFYKTAPNYWETDANHYPNALNWCDCVSTSIGYFENNAARMTSNLTPIPGGGDFVKLTKFKPYLIENLHYEEGDPEENKYIDPKNYKFGVKTILITRSQAHSYHEEAMAVLQSLVRIYGNSNIGLYYTYSKGGDGVITESSKFVYADNLQQIVSNVKYNDFVFVFSSFETDSLIFLTIDDSKNDLTYKYIATRVLPAIKKELQSGRTTDIDIPLENLIQFFQSIVEPSFIYLHSSLNYQRIDSHSVESKEIEYTKDNNTTGTIIRYTGSIKPTLVDLKNVVEFQLRYYENLDNDTDTNRYLFEEGMKQGYLPYYISSGYWYLEPTTYSSRNDFELAHLIEDKWYDFSIVYNIDDTMYLELESELKDDKNYYKLEELVDRKIGEMYPNIGSSGAVHDYFMSLYEMSSDFEYATDENNKPIFHDVNHEKFKYIYRVKLTLK